MKFRKQHLHDFFLTELTMVIYLKYFDEKNGDWNIGNFILFGISPDVPTVKGRIFLLVTLNF